MRRPPPRPCALAFFPLFCVLLVLVTETRADLSRRKTPVVLAVERVGPSVVNIGTVVRERRGIPLPFSGEDFFHDFFPDLFSREYARTSLGSGVIIDGARGHVVTNHHVVSGASAIKVITADDVELEAKLLGSDRRSDLAVLQIALKDPPPQVPLGDSSDLMIGETVIAIGNPFGLSHTVTTGVVSAVNRSVRAGDHVYRSFIQTDASINPGNSGGPLLNLDGEIVGINTAIYQKAQGIGFAIPMNKVRRIVAELVAHGEVRPLWLGAELQELTQDMRRHFALPEKASGVLVKDVAARSPADAAGLQRGDILVRIGDLPVPSMGEFGNILSEFQAGETAPLGIRRKGKELTLEALLAPFPMDVALDAFARRTGIKVGALSKAHRKRWGTDIGVSITAVSPQSEGGRIGLKPEDVILKVDDVAIEGIEAFKKIIAQRYHEGSLTLLVQRGRNGYSVTLPF